MDQITVNATVDQVRAVTRFINKRLVLLGCSERVMVHLDVAIDEIFSNIVRYAYNPNTGTAMVRIEVEEDPLCVVITFIDHGVPFDPLARQEPDTTGLPKAKRPIGGLGLFLVKKTMDHVAYEYKDGQNILIIRKKV